MSLVQAPRLRRARRWLPEADPPPQATTGVERITFIEGLRGIAASIVVLAHFFKAWPEYGTTTSVFHASGRELATWIFFPDGEMVALFLMISAFSLTYSEDRRRAAGRKATSTIAFFRRRAWRIGPTYYVAAIFGLAMALVIPASAAALFPTTAESHAVTLPGTLAHVVLLHNLSFDWQFQGNSPLWSMAYEAQLYLVFPLLYLAFRKYNPFVVGLSMAAVLLVAIKYGASDGYRWWLPFYFVLGLLLATTYRDRLRWIPTRVALAIGLSALIAGYCNVGFLTVNYRQHALWGAAFVFLILAMTRVPETRWNPACSKTALWLGRRSYSLYAMHWIILLAFVWVTDVFSLSGDAWIWTMGLTGSALSVAVAALTFRLVEAPSLRRVRAVAS